jgi:peroxiredoxin
MLRMLNTVVLAAMLAFTPACSLVQTKPLPVSEALPEPAKIVQKTINETYVTLIAAVNTTFDYVAQGWMTKAEGRAYYEKLVSWKKDLALAQDYLDMGLTANAMSQAEIANKAVAILHAEIMKRKGVAK